MKRNFAFAAIGMTAVIALGGINLSVGSVVMLSAMAFGMAVAAGQSFWVPRSRWARSTAC